MNVQRYEFTTIEDGWEDEPDELGMQPDPAGDYVLYSDFKDYLERVDKAMEYMSKTQGCFDEYTDKIGGYNYQTGKHCQSRGKTKLEAVEDHMINSDEEGNLL